MDKDKFVEVLKKAGISANIENGMVTIPLVDADKAEVSSMFTRVKLIANKVGYKHSFRVTKLEEANG